ncbi:MAG: winged helix DNA-binding domain-containing protein [Rhodococcus sp. (in: high G+C Gram-positive bacteria)]
MKVTDRERRGLLVHRHAVGLGAPLTPDEVVRRIVALHATDPASVSLQVLARSTTATLDAVRDAMYTRHALVRVMAMRRTLFVIDRQTMPTLQAGAGAGVARTLRTRLLKQLSTMPTDPVIADPPGWLARVESAVDAALAASGTATGAELSKAVPELRTAFLPTTDKVYDVRRYVTSSVLTLLSAEGRIVRVEPRGTWTSRHHTWAPVSYWWPDGVPTVDEASARIELARLWLEAFGPATMDDLQWWTGWNKGHTTKAVAALDIVKVELSTGTGIMLTSNDIECAQGGVALLPALDATPMGWKDRRWFLPDEYRPDLFDTFGNVGPTIWMDGRVVGAWAVRGDGDVVTRLFENVDKDAVAVEAARIEAHLDGVAITPSFPTPLEKALRTGSAK